MKALEKLFFIFFIFFSLEVQGQDFFLRGEDSRTKRLDYKTTIDNGKTTHERSLTLFVHYPPAKEEYATKVIEILQQYLGNIHDYFQYVPQEDVHFVVDSYDAANGSAMVFPRNLVRLNDFPPYGMESLVTGADWLSVLVVHEYIHILTIEMTHGYMQVLRKVFGSSVKWAGIMPRWFLEGIAVWAESYFTGIGRIQHPWIRQQALQFIKDHEFCHDLHCFDLPHYYPFGHSAYWVGGLFLDFIERNATGSMACLALENSKNLPFSLNRSFKHCLKKSAQELFQAFVKDLEQNQPMDECPLKKHPGLCGELLASQIKVDWFQGFIETDQYVILVVNQGRRGVRRERFSEKVHIYKSSDQSPLKPFRSFRIDYPIDQIHPISEISSDFMVVGADMQFNRYARKFFHVNFMDKHIRELNPKALCSQNYKTVVKLYPSSKKTYCLSYQSPSWVLSDSKEESVIELDKFANFYQARIAADNQIQTLDGPSFSPSSWSVAQSNQGALPSEQSDEPTESDDLEDSIYQSWRYLKPTYLLANYFTGGNIHSVGLSTQLADPLNKQSIYLEGYYNIGVNETSPYSGVVGYSYNYYRFTLDLGYQRFLAASSIRTEDGGDAYNISEGISGGVSWQSFLRYGIYTHRLSYQDTQQIDPIFGSREIQNFRYTGRFLHFSPSVSSRYRGGAYNFSIDQFSSNLNSSDYWGAQFRLRPEFRMTDDFHIIPMAAYGRLFKSSRFREGILYGGGADSFFHGAYYFNSYALPYTDIFGNEIATAQVRTEWTFARPFWGKGLRPLTVQNLSLLSGSEYFYADFFVVNRNLYRDKDFISIYSGLKADAMLFYLAPVSLEFVLSRVMTVGSSPIVANLLLTSNITF